MDWEASLRVMSVSDLAPEDHGTIQKSKDRSVVVTENGTIQTTEEAAVRVCDLDSLLKFTC